MAHGLGAMEVCTKAMVCAITTFHKHIPFLCFASFQIQGGDPTATGTGLFTFLTNLQIYLLTMQSHVLGTIVKNIANLI